ncbi:hypothetical protein P43SY_008944 [Pythium insidiosum]|uniref:Centrosomal protein of 44 kDa n=1 Tax=Pythium insidiosum TaxID=114742 RepID=A0AAD5LPT7_PYTIN|nr:hypothetical protein P43SY_008944 [Pythium insidiosum]
MGTGDLKNNVERLRKLLKAARYPHIHAVISDATAAPTVAELLRVLHFALLDFSRPIARELVEKGYDLYGKTDARFVEQTFRVLREEFHYFPSLTTTQFLSTNYLERKVLLTADAVELILKRHDELLRLKRQQQAPMASHDDDEDAEMEWETVAASVHGDDADDHDEEFVYSDDEGDVDWEEVPSRAEPEAEASTTEDDPQADGASQDPDSEAVVHDLNAVNWDHINAVLQRKESKVAAKTPRKVVHSLE